MKTSERFLIWSFAFLDEQKSWFFYELPVVSSKLVNVASSSGEDVHDIWATENWSDHPCSDIDFFFFDDNLDLAHWWLFCIVQIRDQYQVSEVDKEHESVRKG